MFSDFIPSDKSVWQRQVEIETKKPFSELNKDRNGEYRKIAPYYSIEEYDANCFKQLHAAQKKNPGWLNMPEIKIRDFSLTNTKIQEALRAGAQGVLIDAAAQQLNVPDCTRLLHQIRNTDTPVFIKTAQNPNQVFGLLSNHSGYQIKGGIAYDYLANWMRTLQPFDQNLTDLGAVCKETESVKQFFPIMVESHIFHNAGATPEQELAYLLGSLVFYLDKLTDAGLSADLILKKTFLSVSVGTEYLTEIAKLRALRLLYNRIAAAYGVEDDLPPYVHASISSLYTSESSPYTNILRATSSAMSAVIGGCDLLTIPAFDQSFSDTNEFSERIARNISSILLHESYINQVIDPAAGSYYIDIQSKQIADAAWQLFLALEAQGGIITYFQSGYIQDQIEVSWQVKKELLRKDYVMVGVNKYREDPQNISKITKENDLIKTGYRNLPNRNLSTYWNTHQQ